MKTLRLLSWITARFIVEQHREIGFVARLALLGLIIGVSVLVIVLSVVNGFQKELETKVLSNLPQAQILIADGLSKQDLARLQNLDDSGVTAIAPFMQRSGLIAAKGEVCGVSINGVDTDSYAQVSSIFRYSVKDHLLGDKRFNVIVGSRIARTLGVGIGDPVTLLLPESKVDLAGSAFRQKKFYVSDIFDSRTLQDATHVYISLSDAGALFRQREPSGLHARLENLFDSSALWPYFSAKLGDRVYSITNWFSTNGNLFRAIAVQKMTMFVLLSFLIAVAAFNLVSGMVMVVEHRKSDIAILMSMGAGSRVLMSLFCLLGMQICLIGVMVGLILGVGFALILPFVFELVSVNFDLNLMSQYFVAYLPVDILLTDIGLVFLITMFIGFLASLYPARRASKLIPSRVLAHE